MPDRFDVYHKWLGIPPGDQPPDCYRLLGIPKYESDPEVIASAADQRMAFVQSKADGSHVDISQRLLNELARARITLIDPQKRANYDLQLPGEPINTLLEAPLAGVTTIEDGGNLLLSHPGQVDQKTVTQAWLDAHWKSVRWNLASASVIQQRWFVVSLAAIVIAIAVGIGWLLGRLTVLGGTGF